MVERVSADGAKMIGDDWALDDSDRAVLADPRVAEMNRVVTEEIAARLCLSAYTVETHRKNIGAKLNLHGAAEWILYAVRKGIVG